MEEEAAGKKKQIVVSVSIYMAIGKGEGESKKIEEEEEGVMGGFVFCFRSLVDIGRKDNQTERETDRWVLKTRSGEKGGLKEKSGNKAGISILLFLLLLLLLLLLFIAAPFGQKASFVAFTTPHPTQSDSDSALVVMAAGWRFRALIVQLLRYNRGKAGKGCIKKGRLAELSPLSIMCACLCVCFCLVLKHRFPN